MKQKRTASDEERAMALRERLNPRCSFHEALVMAFHDERERIAAAIEADIDGLSLQRDRIVLGDLARRVRANFHDASQGSAREGEKE